MSLQTRERIYADRYDPPPSNCQINDRRIELFGLLGDPATPYLCTFDLLAYLKASPGRFRNALQHLAGDKYIKRLPIIKRAGVGGLNKPQIYILQRRGSDQAKLHGYEGHVPKPRDEPNSEIIFAHDFMASQLMFLFRYGARERGLTFYSWNDMVRLKTVPAGITTPYPMFVTIDGQRHKIAPDGRPFVLERKDPDGSTYFFFVGIEADTGTEQERINKNFPTNATIELKFRNYLQMTKERTYEKQFGFHEHGYVIFATSLPDRIDNMKALLAEITNGKGSPDILFRRHTYPTFLLKHWPQKPSDIMITQNYERVGYPDINFLTA